MIESMVTHTLSNSIDVDGVQLSMSGREKHVLRTGAVVINGDVFGFEVTREKEDGNIVVKVKVDSIDWADKETVSLPSQPAK
jgi:formylmethanofuran dehydrogenase subunit C